MNLKNYRRAPSSHTLRDEPDLANVRAVSRDVYKQFCDHRIDSEEAAKQIRQQTTRKRTFVDLLLEM
jgi:hypothetical protein